MDNTVTKSTSFLQSLNYDGLDRGLMRLTHIRSRQPCPTTLEEDAVARLAREELFKVMDDIDADYENLVQTVTAIANSYRSAAPNHSSRRISASTRALLEKRRIMGRQENHIDSTQPLCKVGCVDNELLKNNPILQDRNS
uniref:Uncharacterized protein n=1 Tax=Haemonchus contortus TaxID=6289 RepID=A0A7I4Z5E2_HAECO